MGRFTYIEDPDRARDSEDLIVHNARIKVLSVKVNDIGIEYICRLTDINLEEPVTFCFTVDSRDWQVVSIAKIEESVASNHLEEVKTNVPEVWGYPDDALCYGVQMEDIPQRLGRPIEWDLLILPSGDIDYTHFRYNDPPIPFEKGVKGEQ